MQYDYIENPLPLLPLNEVVINVDEHILKCYNYVEYGINRFYNINQPMLGPVYQYFGNKSQA